MAKETYNNIWTKLNLENVRGNKIFKGLWRGARVAIIGALLALANNMAFTMGGFGLGTEYVVILAPIVEKWLREFVKQLEF